MRWQVMTKVWLSKSLRSNPPAILFFVGGALFVTRAHWSVMLIGTLLMGIAVAWSAHRGAPEF